MQYNLLNTIFMNFQRNMIFSIVSQDITVGCFLFCMKSRETHNELEQIHDKLKQQGTIEQCIGDKTMGPTLDSIFELYKQLNTKFFN